MKRYLWIVVFLAGCATQPPTEPPDQPVGGVPTPDKLRNVSPPCMGGYVEVDGRCYHEESLRRSCTAWKYNYDQFCGGFTDSPDR